jgi:Ca2+-binding EF-hand superfamily protein
MSHPISSIGWSLISAQVLKPACIAALKRIFKLCDTNKDGILDASELNEFQVCRSWACTIDSSYFQSRENVLMHHYNYKN